MTHLRQIMLDELERRNYAPGTIRIYIRTVEHFAQHFRCSPDTKTCRDQSLACGLLRCWPSVARNARSFRTDSALLRKLVRKAVIPRSSPCLAPDAPNPPECSRTA